MIDLLLKLLEKLGTLAEYRAAHKHRAYKELAEPMFNELLEVHKDYMLQFSEARRMAEQNLNDLKPAIEYLEKQRAAFQPIRVKLAALAETLRQPRDQSAIDEFLFDVARYFPVGDVIAEQATASTSLIRELKQQFLHNQDPIGQEPFLDRRPIWLGRIPENETTMTRNLFTQAHRSPTELIDAFMALQQQKWKNVCEAFAKVKAADLAF